MSPFEVYKDYLALRNHFNSQSYDYFKYGGKGSGGIDAFNRRKDKFFFEKMSKHRDPHGFMLANFVQNPKSWIRDMAYSESAEKIYTDWLKKTQSLTFIVQSDLGRLREPFNENFLVEEGSHCHILSLYLGKRIQLETVCVLVDLTRCLSYWDKRMMDDVVWQDTGFLIKKYTPFIRYDPKALKKIVVDYFHEG
jgi:hypothetical protein